MVLKFVDASDYSGRNVNDNLYNIRSNSDRLSSSTDIIFSIHFNGFNEQATGTEMWSYLGDNVSKPVAAELSKAVAEAQGIPNRGQKSTTNLYVVSYTKAHMILMEICFLDNKREIENYIKKEQKVIDAIINVCKQFPHLTFSATSAGHGGYNMMDPGVSRHGYKENELSQRINKAIINYKLQPTKPVEPSKPNVSKPKPISNGWYAEKATFKSNKGNKPIMVLNSVPNGNIIGKIYPGDTVKYDAVKHDSGFVWVRQPRDNGEFGYVAIGEGDGSKRTKSWGPCY